MNWKEIYEKVLKNVCEKPYNKDTNIVEVDFFEIADDLVKNENAQENSLFGMKLVEPLDQYKCQRFCELVYSYIGLNIYDYLPKQFKSFKKNK